MHSVPTKSLPERLRKFTRRHKVLVSLMPDGETHRTSGSWWDGGSCRTHQFVRLSDGATKPAPVATAPSQFGGFWTDLRPEPGWALVVGGTSCGKPATAQFHVLPEDVALFCGVYQCRIAYPACLDALIEAGRYDDVRRVNDVFPALAETNFPPDTSLARQERTP